MADEPSSDTEPGADAPPAAPQEDTAPAESASWSPPTKHIMAVALVLASLTVLYLSRNVLAVAALAGLIAFLVAPVIRFMHLRLRMPRALALLGSYVAVFIGLLVVGFMMVDGVVGAVSELDVAQAEESLRSTAEDVLESVREFSIAGYTVDLTDAVDPLLEDLRGDDSGSSDSGGKEGESESEKRLQLSSDQIQSLFGGLTSSVSTVGSSILAAFMSGIITVLVAIYLNADSTKFLNSFRRTVPAQHRGDIERLGQRTLAIWRGYVYGQLLNSLMVGVLMWMVLWLIGLPGAFVFALTLGVLNMIPTFGPILAAIPAVLAALALGSTRLDWGNLGFAVLVTILYLVVVQLQANLVAPLITGRAVRLSPATVIIGLLVGVQVGGLVGALLVVPVIATGKEYGRYVIAKLTDGDPFPPRSAAPEPPREPAGSGGATDGAAGGTAADGLVGGA
ncbi:MAG: AI-2E family transporter [Microthrixaceae bacterium]|nr:AI-2E family transporter [Microthrixaceae bacterium]